MWGIPNKTSITHSFGGDGGCGGDGAVVENGAFSTGWIREFLSWNSWSFAAAAAAWLPLRDLFYILFFETPLNWLQLFKDGVFCFYNFFLFLQVSDYLISSRKITFPRDCKSANIVSGLIPGRLRKRRIWFLVWSSTCLFAASIPIDHQTLRVL